MTGRVAETAAVSALALVMTLVLGASVLRSPSERVFGMETVGRHHDPFTVMEQFGSAPVFGPSLQPLTDLPGMLLARAAGPVAAYNWLVLLTFPLSAAGAYVLARHLQVGPVTSAAAAMAFAFSPFHLAHAAYHPHIAQTQWVPLYLFTLWRCLERPAPPALVLLVLSAAGVALSSFYGGLVAGVITPIAIGSHWFFAPRPQPNAGRRRAIVVATLAALAACGITYVWYAAPTVLVNRGAFGFPREDLFQHSAKWWAYLVPPVQHPLLGDFARRVWADAGVQTGLLEQQVSLGWGLIILALVAVFAWLRHRDAPPLAFVPVLTVVGAAALICSLSPERAIGPFTFVRPAAFLYGVVPMFRSYARFGVVVQLMVVLLAAIGAERLWRSPIRAVRIACVALVVLVAAEYFVWPPALSRDVLPTAAHRWVAQQAAPVHALDCAPFTRESASISWLADGRISLTDARVDDCTEPNVGDKLSAAGYTHVIVRRDTPTGRVFAGRGTPDGLGPERSFPDGELFAVRRPAPLVYTAWMSGFYPREHDESWTWRWMGPEASWTIVNRSDRTIVAAALVETTAFGGDRSVHLVLDGRKVQTLTVQEPRGTSRIGPLELTPGSHELLFLTDSPATVADELLNNGDWRPLSIGVGGWRWVLEGDRR